LSGGRVESVIKQFPPEAIRADQIPSDWIRPGSTRVDLSNPEAATQFAELIVEECKSRALPIVFLDNILHPSALSGWISWKDTCRFVGLVKRGVNANGSSLIVNIAVAPWAMSDADVVLLSDAVDGMSFEMPFHRRARGNRKRTRLLIDVYRKWLAAGKLVVLIPIDRSLKTKAQKDSESRLLAAFAMLIRNPGDRLFVTWPFYRIEPDWAGWPKRLGLPRGEWRFEADHILARSFKNGTLWIDVLRRSVEIRS
jgi:hypothetical protein